MCGIAGWIGLPPEDPDCAERMARALRHRGPDGCGMRSWPGATLVHTRLSVIDLSPAGAQPMANENGAVWTVFNGEIYNHHRLRRDLESRGHKFRGRSDTETLPHLYEEEGPALVSRLRGMFALALYDTATQTLLLARDRFGIKPLFYAPGKNRLAFASEIGALLELPEIDTRPDRQALSDFAALFYIPAPQTFYQGIRSLEPGELLVCRWTGTRLSWSVRRYHQWEIAPDPGLTLAAAAEKAGDLLSRSVDSQKESDVPLGSLLSGGIDSSLVSALAQAGGAERLRTFNVRFSDPAYDETEAALEVAKHIDSRHEILEMDSVRGSWDHITGLLKQAGQPYADTSLFAANAVCKLMRRHVTVALSGDGGDEGFGGYNMFWQLERIARWQRLPLPVQRCAPFPASRLAGLGLIPKYLPRRLREMAGADDVRVTQGLFCWIQESEHQQLCRITDALPVARLFESRWNHHLAANASRLETLSALTTEALTRLALPNDYLCKVDMASMRESLEVRVPMLDEDLYAFGMTLPHHLKVQKTTGKRVLRELARRLLPSEIVDRPKQGFGIPVDAWVDEDFRRCLQENLFDPACRLSEYFDPEVYQPMAQAFVERSQLPGISRQGLYQRVIMLLSAHLALEQERARAVAVTARI